MADAPVDSATLERLCGLLDVAVAGVRIEPLSGGLSNRTFRLVHGSESWAVRLPVDAGGPPPATLDPASEERLLRTLARSGFTPDVVLYDPPTGALVTRYLSDAVPWTAERSRLPGSIRRIAATLRSLHEARVAPKLRAYRPTGLARDYLASARRANRRRHGAAAFSDEEARWARDLERLAGLYEATFLPTAICHGDLVAANILDAKKLWLVDFEYAFRAHPILDLASLAGMNDYDASERSLLVEAYFGGGTVPFGSEQLLETIRLGRLLSYFWALSRWMDAPDADAMSRFADSMAAVLR